MQKPNDARREFNRMSKDQAPVFGLQGFFGTGSIVQPELVFLPDGRKQVLSTVNPPAASIVHIDIDLNGSAHLFATGWMLTPTVVITAGHALFVPTGTGAQRVRRVTVRPGRNGAAAPFGAFTSDVFATTTDWLQRQDQRADVAAIKLSQPVPGVGVLHPAVFTDAQLSSMQWPVAGYPFDKSLGTLWSMTGAIEQPDAFELRYTIRVAEGQSGGPVFNRLQTGFFVAGIHVGSDSLNRAVRVTPLLLQTLKFWAS